MKRLNDHVSFESVRRRNTLGTARAAAFALLLSMVSPLAAQSATGPAKFIPTFLVYYGGGSVLGATNAPKLAKFDLLDLDRFRYNQLGAWLAVKALNPKIQIYLYEMGPESQNYMDATPVVSINGLGRHDVSRGHSMGSLDGNHPELFLLDASGNRIYNTGFSNPAGNQFWYLMDFGSSAFQAYWIEAVKTDIANQPWAADGVHADSCLTFSAAGGYSAASSKYSTDASWSNAMNNFSSAIAAGLHAVGQKLWCNKGSSSLPAGVSAWLALDASPDHPDVLAEEAAFAVTFGPWATQFIPEAGWKSQVDVMGAIKNSKVAMFSSTALGEGQSGTDNWGQPVTYWQTLWYALGSFLLGKNDTLNNAYFGFFGNGASYNRIWWYDEYDKIDLGKALGSYTTKKLDGANVYQREFERGYVLVNPTSDNVESITLPQASRQLTHDNLLSPLESIPIVNAIALHGHNAAILLKAVSPPPPPPAPPPAPAPDPVPPAPAPVPPAPDPIPTAPPGDTDGGGAGGRCFIATAAYGSPMARDVRYLRAFRDQYLLTNKPGRWFVERYYRLSPPLADKLRAHDGWRAVVRVALSPLVMLSKWLVRDDMLEKETADRP